MALVGMIGEDVDGALDGAGGQAVPEREREQVLAPVLDGVELVADDVARRAHPRDAQRTHAPIADVHLPLGRVAPMRDAEGDLRRQHHHIALDAPEDGHGEVGRARARRVEDELVVEPPERQVRIERHDDALAASARERLEHRMQGGIRVLDPRHSGGRAGPTGHDRDLAARGRPLAHAPEVERRGRGREVGAAGSFVYTVTVLVTRPLSRAVSRRTVTVPAPPAGTSCPETSPTVHPHEPLTFSIRNGASPAFSSRKACSTIVPRSTLPKSRVGAGSTSRGAPAAQAAAANPSAAELSSRRYTPRDCPAARTSRCNRRWWRRRWPSFGCTSRSDTCRRRC